jgi:hypothetical protein
MDPVRGRFAQAGSGGESGERATESGAAPQTAKGAGGAHRPVLPAGIHEAFVAVSERVPDGFTLEYRPGLLGKGKVHFVRKGDGIDVWRQCVLIQTMDGAPPNDAWEGAKPQAAELEFEMEPDAIGGFADLPAELAREKSYPIFGRHLKEHLYREELLQLWKCAALDATSRPDEPKDQFRARLAPLVEAKRTVEREKLEKSYATKLAGAETKITRARSRVSTQRWQFFARMGSMMWVIADTILSVLGRGLPGRRRSLNPAFSSVATERGQHSNAKVSLEAALAEKQRLEEQHQQALAQLESRFDLEKIELEQIELKPQKADIEVDKVLLVWMPWRVSAEGEAKPAY